MNLFFRKHGSGPTMVILHGLYGSSDNWLNMGKRMAEKFTVYLVDLRNHGRSPSAPSHTFNDLKEDLAEFFEMHGIDHATILGHSMGGKAAMWFAAEYPEKIDKLIVADIAPKNYLLVNDNSQYNFHRGILTSMQQINFDQIQNRTEIEAELAKNIESQKVNKFLLKSIKKDKQNNRYKWQLNVDVLYEHLDEIVGGVNNEWFEDRFPIRNYPVIFIRGQKSNYILPEDEELIKNIYPEASIVEIPDAGHWLHAEQPKAFMQAVVQCC